MKRSKMAPAETERALIDHDETDAHFRNHEEHSFDTANQKDTKYSWFICCCTFLTQVFVLGVLHAFGVFFVEFVKEFSAPKGEAAWIGSLAYGLSMTFGPITSILIRNYGYRAVMMTGGAICTFSVVVSSFATSIPQLFLSFSLLYGIGTCMATGPTMTITTVYFDKYLTIATGFTVSGSSFGTLVMGPLSQIIIDTLGWRNAFRIFAGLHIITIILNSQIKAPVVYNKTVQKKRSLLLDFQIWKNRVFVVWTLAITLVMFGFYIPYVHLVSYAIDQGISPNRASMLMMVLGATTAFGRILFGKIVEIGVLNRIHMHQLSMIVTGTGVMLLPLIHTYIGIIIYVVTVGLVDGCYVVLLPILTTSLVGLENSVLAWGFLIGTSSITFTLGPPVAGALYDMTGSYNIAFHCAGVPIVCGALVLFLIPWAKRTTKQPGIMDIVNEYTVSDTFRMNSEASGIRDTGAMIATVDDVIQTIALPTSSFVTVRSVATSTSDKKPLSKDQSTSTSPSSSYRRQDIEDILSQLSRNDVMFTEIMKHSFTSEMAPTHESESSQYIPCILPPPSDPGRCYSGLKQDEISLRISRPGNIVDRRSIDQHSQQSSLSSEVIKGSVGFIQDSVSEDVFIPSASHLFSLSAMTSSGDLLSGERTMGERTTADTIQKKEMVVDSVDQKPTSSRERSEEGFDQIISDEVGQLLNKLKIPSPGDKDVYDMEKTIVKDEQPQQKFTSAAAAFAEPFPSFPTAGTSNLAASSAPQTNHVSHEHHQPVEHSAALSFGSENQLTVIPGQNPFNKNKPKPGTIERLEELFVEPENLRTQQSTSFDVLEIGSSESIRQTSSTGEIDVFKHLFDDEEENMVETEVTQKE